MVETHALDVQGWRYRSDHWVRFDSLYAPASQHGPVTPVGDLCDIGSDVHGQRNLPVLVCPRKSGPVFELVPAPIMELRHGQESQA